VAADVSTAADVPAVSTAADAPDSSARALGLGTPVPPAPLSFTVYTLDDLERRSDAPVSLRTSYASFDTTASRGPSRAGRFDLRSLGVTMGIIVGASLTILFAVLLAAELTDDLRPGAAAHLASSEIVAPSAKTALDARAVAPATSMAAMGVQPVEPGPATTSVAPNAPPSARPPTPVSPQQRAAKKPAKPKAARPYRTSDALYNP
jgi:hypothetical protein